MSVSFSQPDEVITSHGRKMNVSLGSHVDAAITLLFDTISTHNCNTRQQIVDASHNVSKQPFRNVPEVDQALAMIRDPAISDHYGWTVPPVPRGKAPMNSTYRFFVVDKRNGVMSVSDTERVEHGVLSSTKLVSTTTERLADIMRQTAAVAPNSATKKFCLSQAKVLDGVSAQTHGEADRLAKQLKILTSSTP